MALTLTRNEDANGVITVDIVGKQGDRWAFEITITQANGNPMDLTNYAARGQIKKTLTDVTPVASLVCTISAPATGKVAVSLSAETTKTIQAAAADYTKNKYLYDIEVYKPLDLTEVTTYLRGNLYVIPEVTT